MRFSGIVACALAVFAFAPCQAVSATNTGAAGARAAEPFALRTAKAKPKKPEPPKQSSITFFWSKGAEGSSMFNVFREKMLLSVDGKPAGKLTQGEYLSITLEPGRHTYGYERVAFSSEGETKREIDVAPGQNLYFEIIDKSEAGFLHTIAPQEVAAEQAQAEISKLRTPLQTATKEAVTGMPAAPGAPAAAGVSASAPVTGKPGKKGAAPQPVAQSYITFYWPKTTSGTVAFMKTFGERFGISVDGQSVGTFGEGEFVSVPVQPGSHTYSYAKATQVSFNEKPHPVDVAPGQSVFFQITEEQQGMVTVSYPQQVSADQGQQALAGLQASENRD